MFLKSKPAPGAGSLHPKSAAKAQGRPVATFSVIGADVVISGNISATVDLHIDGAVEGDISCASLVQGEGSRIKGSVVAESARLAGSLDGSISARELVIESTAHVSGDVSYERITIETGGNVEGRFTVKGGAALLAAEGENPLKLVTAVPAE